ncbi:MAG: RNA polymerase sigma-70 factor [Tannerellaceae bacterium]|nr:RNA polymerase sigma-70 factor [Tannerellaceae bacterium]
MSYTLKNDKELVILLRQGDELAFSELYIRYKDKLSHYCYKMLKIREEAHDMVQEIFLQVWQSAGLVNPELSFSSYLHTIAHNRIMNHFRGMDVKERAFQIIREKFEEKTADEPAIIYEEYVALVNEAIELLPPKRKEVFLLSRRMEYSHKEIASQLGISVYTVQEYISSSLTFLRDYLKKRGDWNLSLFILFVLNIY